MDFSLRIVEKYENMKFHENPSIGSRDPCGWTDGRTDRDMTKLIVAFHNFANAPKNTLVYVLLLLFFSLSPSLFLMFADNSWSFYLPPPDLGACQPYMYKIVLFCEKKPDSMSVWHWQYLLCILWISSILWGEFRKFLYGVLHHSCRVSSLFFAFHRTCLSSDSHSTTSSADTA
jgi:hypothetical protein